MSAWSRGCRKKAGDAESVEAANMGYLCEKFGIEKGAVHRNLREPVPRGQCMFEGEGKRAKGNERSRAKAS